MSWQAKVERMRQQARERIAAERAQGATPNPPTAGPGEGVMRCTPAELRDAIEALCRSAGMTPDEVQAYVARRRTRVLLDAVHELRRDLDELGAELVIEVRSRERPEVS